MVIHLGYEGTWFEEMEVQDFPFDAQSLTVSMICNTTAGGMTPLVIKVSDRSLVSSK